MLKPSTRHASNRTLIARLEVVFRQEAADNLQSIYDYIAAESGGHDVAIGYVRRLRERCLRIGDAPFGGRRRDDLAPGLRTIAFERRLLVAYLVRLGRVEIVNVFDGRRDYASRYAR